jgi:hypothetical protein
MPSKHIDILNIIKAEVFRLDEKKVKEDARR